jgi:alpha-L-fucosidase 2
LAQAARKSLDRRLAAKGGQTGWSRAWLINFMACLGDGEAALEHLNDIFNRLTLPNLFNTHPPFQIDGNFGALSGMTQMLVRSRLRFSAINGSKKVLLDLLPALPQSWPTGRIKGVRAKGNLELDLEWQNGQPVSIVIRNNGSEIPVSIRRGTEKTELTLPPGETKVE